MRVRKGMREKRIFLFRLRIDSTSCIKKCKIFGSIFVKRWKRVAKWDARFVARIMLKKEVVGKSKS
jgi:hypothetical protein